MTVMEVTKNMINSRILKQNLSKQVHNSKLITITITITIMSAKKISKIAVALFHSFHTTRNRSVNDQSQFRRKMKYNLFASQCFFERI